MRDPGRAVILMLIFFKDVLAGDPSLAKTCVIPGKAAVIRNTYLPAVEFPPGKTRCCLFLSDACMTDFFRLHGLKSYVNRRNWVLLSIYGKSVTEPNARMPSRHAVSPIRMICVR